MGSKIVFFGKSFFGESGKGKEKLHLEQRNCYFFLLFSKSWCKSASFTSVVFFSRKEISPMHWQSDHVDCFAIDVFFSRSHVTVNAAWLLTLNWLVCDRLGELVRWFPWIVLAKKGCLETSVYIRLSYHGTVASFIRRWRYKFIIHWVNFRVVSNNMIWRKSFFREVLLVQRVGMIAGDFFVYSADFFRTRK